jgi:hypothetical protein
MDENPTRSAQAGQDTGKSVVVLTVLTWVAGFAISILAIWGITAFATENFYPMVWSEELQRNIPTPGWSFHNRNEAWAETQFGELGLKGTPNVAEPSVPKIFLWGDSFVEAAQVPDHDKMHRHLNRLLPNGSDQEVQVIPLGHRFQSFADYVLQIPAYEKEIAPCMLHIIHLATLEDTYPDDNFRISLFLSEPNFHFVKYDNEFREIESPIYESKLKSQVYRLRLQFFLRTKKQILQIARLEGLRFSLGEQHPTAKGARMLDDDWNRYLTPEWAAKAPPVKAWEFLIDSLRSTRNTPILVVYAPATPTLEKGETIAQNPEEKQVRVFGEICRERGLGFINMEQSFLEYHQVTGKFHKGFQTSRPWEGHYNAEGHRLVAEAIHRWIQENHNAVYPD